jgi:Domain of unknown function (DUF1929)/Legume lectin domain/Glyoxal oxidase N-terminus/Chitobiase/beta-hexosaminidase C-terminal domain/PKD domain
MNSRYLFLPATLSAVLCVLTLFTPAAMSQANVQGQWQTLPYTMPFNPVHAGLLNNGKVLIVSGSGNVPANTDFESVLWDPQAGTLTTQKLEWDMFCNGMVFLPDGRAFIDGGTLQYEPFFGQSRMAMYDATTNVFTTGQSMAHGRWYPTATVLSDGRVMVFSGTNETGSTNTAVEIYTVGSGWSVPTSAPWTPPLYPRLHLLPNGNVFYSGSTTTSSIFNPTTNAWTTNVAVTNFSGTRTYGSSVLLPLIPANGYKPKVMILGGGNPATATTEIIDLSVATPKWVFGPNMSAPRIEMNATLLPTGKVLASGGSLNDEDLTTAALGADLYDPNTNMFTSAGTEAFARLYHSVSLLMPDATVLVAGGNPQRGTFEPHMEIYSPAYLFNPDGSSATRPTITSVSTPVVGYNSDFSVQTPDAASISTVVLMKNGAVTHAFNMDQRYVGLSFTAGSGVLNVTGPPNGSIAPPGYYMLFLVNNAGVPSVAKIVQISPAPGDTPPTGTITAPAANVSIPVGSSVSYAGTATPGSGSTISNYFWSFEGGTPSTSTLANPGAVTYPNSGTFGTTLTVTDNQDVSDPHPPTRTVTVLGPPNFTVGASPSSQAINQGASAAYTVAITPNNNFTGNVALSVSGVPTGATTSFNPTSITTSGNSMLTVQTSTSTPTGVYALTITATSGALVNTTTVSLVVSQAGSTTPVNFGAGFSGTGLQFNGHATLSETRLQLTDANTPSEKASAFWKSLVNIQSFTNVFTFQLTNPNADGFTFTIQKTGLTAIGAVGAGLGYGSIAPGQAPGIGKSVAVKFDLFNTQGEGNNSTGLYTNGASPTIPATTLGGGVNLHSGDIFQVQMTYDGTTLSMTITDTSIPTDTFTMSWPIDIPGTVGANTAYVGFTAGTGGQSAVQEILNWTYTLGSPQNAAATPTFIPVAGTYTSAQTVSIADSTSGASIFYTLDGTRPATTAGGSTHLYSTPINVASTETINALATASGFSTSAVASATYTINTGSPPDFTLAASGSQSVVAGGSAAYTATVSPVNGFTGPVTLSVSAGLPTGATATFNPTSITTSGSSTLTVGTSASTPVGTYTLTITGTAATITHTTTISLMVAQNGGVPAVNFSSGFSATGMQFNGHTQLNGTRLQLTDASTPSEKASAFWTTPVNVQNFTNIFTFQLTNPNADGFTFTIQRTGVTAIGAVGGGLGYGAIVPGQTPGIGKSVAIKFDLFSNQGEGNNSTGLYINGASPTIPATTIGGGVNLHSGDIFQVQMTYDGTTLTMTITDTTTPADTFTMSWPINIPGTVGANTAFVGFTGGTGGQSAVQEILNWTFGNAVPNFTLGTSPGSQSIAAGSSAPFTTTVTPSNGFTGALTLSVSTGLPTGATATFNPSSVTTSGSSTLTVATSASTPVGTYPLTISGTNGSLTRTTTTTLIVTQGGKPPVINLASGFTTTGMQFNGHTQLNGTRLQLTDASTPSEKASAFWTTLVNVQGFTSVFTFQLTNPTADGFTFTIQKTGATAIGAVGGGLGYGSIAPGQAPGIGKSVAVKFDLFSNQGEGNNSTGLYINGASPTIPATTIGGGVNLHSGDIFQVQMTYDGTTLTMTITDTTTPTDTFTMSWPIDIPGTVGANTAFVGFTGGTGGQSAIQEILNWTYSTP